MARLSDLKARIDAYLLIKGDKDITSIASCQGGTDEFVLHLADIWNGPIGSNPFNGRDTLNIPKSPATTWFVQNPQNAQNVQNTHFVQGGHAQSCSACPEPLPVEYGQVRDMVENRMQELMPGWFTKLDETMNPEGSGPDVSAVTRIYMQDTTKKLDDIIHEYFADSWFKYHGDGEDWW